MTDMVHPHSLSALEAAAVGVGSGIDPATAVQRAYVIAEIANFLDLRRRIGLVRADALIDLVTVRLQQMLPGTGIEIISRTQVGFWLSDRAAQTLPSTLAAIERAFIKPFDLDEGAQVVWLDVGSATATLHGLDDVSVIEQAERVIDAKRRERRSPDRAFVHLENPDRQLARELDLAIDRDELLLMYQPKVHVRRQEIASAEGLIRWRHPERGLILPGNFIGIAEGSDIISRLTLWTIRQAIEDRHALVARGHDLRLFINISGRLLADPVFVDRACALIGETDTKLGFEITETSVIGDPEIAIRNLKTFADFGVTIAIDDYGAGLSSLAYLKQLPARELKIDKLFVTQLTSSHRDPLIVRSTIDLAHALDMEVVAEGVETHAALALLTVMGCDMVQGFLISRPVALEALMTFLADDWRRCSQQDPRNAFLQFANEWKRA